MGLDVYGFVVVGEKLILKEVETKSTKYNEDTGEPYERISKAKVWVLEADHSVCLESILGGMTFLSNEHTNEAVLGIKISCTDMRGFIYLSEINMQAIYEAKHLYEKACGRKATVWNFMEVSR